MALIFDRTVFSVVKILKNIQKKLFEESASYFSDFFVNSKLV